MSKKDANQKHYFSPLSAIELAQIMSKACDLEIPIQMWIEGKSEAGVEKYTCAEFDQEEQRLTLRPSSGILSKLFNSKFIKKKVFIKIGDEKFQFFTTSQLNFNKAEKYYWVALKSDVFRSQQRANYRLSASRHIKVQFKIADEMVFDGLDISAGGVSFIIGPNLKELFAKGKEFHKCTLRFNRYKYFISSAKVAGVWAQKNGLGEPIEDIKIGISFTEIDQHIEEELFKEINSEARAEEMRKQIASRKGKS
jgi:hypothetical protein